MVTNVPSTVPDYDDFNDDEAMARSLRAVEAQTNLLGEQLLVLQRIERSLETLMTRQAQAVQPETPSSVEIGRNAKHEPVWTIKVYCAVGEEQQALERALALEKRLQDEYGMAGLP